jgi:UDP-N-acetylglucosamine 2-epimerase
VPAFRASLVGIQNPYGDGATAQRVVNILKELPDRQTLLRKRFHDDVVGIPEVQHA